MSLYDKTDPRTFERRQLRKARAGHPVDTTPRCDHCAQAEEWCLCGGEEFKAPKQEVE